MPPTIGDLAAEEHERKPGDLPPDFIPAAATDPPGQHPEVEEPGFDWLAFVTRDTGEGEVEDYLTHPLNFTGRRWTARFIRGLTGLFGKLRYALVDIVVALVEAWWTRRNGGNPLAPAASRLDEIREDLPRDGTGGSYTGP